MISDKHTSTHKKNSMKNMKEGRTSNRERQREDKG